ncbi:TetR/AcrR family transcriptional regulator [Clostridiaceae bacterium UIB06]|uniref:TetR/AcrR family transcriptional regulator n=1 Tax=Clostridium thailandense TaxID=2794346 RepID=A0A949TUE9_9CLOT|nr:TetR/AcrR family transcriptional regulator [Clostridium thailandense]MBV7276677.1 TetR/AcrR family transcriptional regulator [Clostridium thailandense]MCH5137723.1 TetR/AcrR family transcriptional regulator [Clostridiaceae bacterium UIB06]
MGTYDKARKHTEDKIIHAFWELYKTQKIEKITVKSITDACGIHRATFYLHYQDVYAILEHIEASLMQSLNYMNTACIETDADMSNFAGNLYALYFNRTTIISMSLYVSRKRLNLQWTTKIN